jgi:ATP-dependent Clp protease ATP-binding subunit ClpA
VEEIIGYGRSEPSGHIPFTPRAKKVLELSLREALQLGHNYIGTEHLLLGLIREGDGVAAQVLLNLGADLEETRRVVVDTIATGGPPVDLGGDVTPDDVAVARHGMLRRMLADESSYLSRALREHGVEPEDLGATLDRLAEGEEDA